MPIIKKKIVSKELRYGLFNKVVIFKVVKTNEHAMIQFYYTYSIPSITA